LLVITVGEIVYYFFLSPKASPNQTNIKERVSPIEEQKIKRLPEGTEAKSLNLVGNLLVTKRAKLEDGALVIDNSDNGNFFGYTISPQKPVEIDSPFRLKLKFKRGAGDNVQLTLYGRRVEEGKEWWEGIHAMFIMDFDDKIYEQKMRIELRDGRSPDAWVLFLDKISRGDPFSIEFLDPAGKNFIVVNKDGEVVLTVDVTKLDKYKFPNGLFPEKKLWPGLIVGPKAKLTINEFVLSFTGH
jgi:hypothetical protein